MRFLPSSVKLPSARKPLVTGHCFWCSHGICSAIERLKPSFVARAHLWDLPRPRLRLDLRLRLSAPDYRPHAAGIIDIHDAISTLLGYPNRRYDRCDQHLLHTHAGAARDDVNGTGASTSTRLRRGGAHERRNPRRRPTRTTADRTRHEARQPRPAVLAGLDAAAFRHDAPTADHGPGRLGRRLRGRRGRRRAQ